jgi:hypothetical protein
MTMRKSTLLLFALLAGCGSREPAQPGPPAAGVTAADPAPAAKAVPQFVDRIWVATESEQVALGDVRAFLADGTMVMASPHATTALGAWRVDGEQLRITEEGIEYPVDVLEQSEDMFRIRIRGPGEPVSIGFKNEGPVLHLSGTVRHLDIEGGVYVISDAAGVNYSPMELPPEFRVDGRQVQVEARRRNDVMSTSMAGPIIEILRVR